MADPKAAVNLGAVLIAIALIVGVISMIYTSNNEGLIVSTENKSSALNASQSDNASMINETSQEQSGQKNYTIEIINFSFEPKELVIKKGDTVKWINKDNSAHTITSDTGNELGSGALIKNETYEHKFSFDGIYNYHCSFHQNTMKGKIIVEI